MLLKRENDMKSSRTLFFGGWSNNGGKLAWDPYNETNKQISTDSSMYFYKLQKLLHSSCKMHSWYLGYGNEGSYHEKFR